MYHSMPNCGKSIEINTKKGRFSRFPIRTPLIKEGDDLGEILSEALHDGLERQDILFLSEKSVACSQGRAIPLNEIRPRPLAVFLSRFVHKSSHGIGLSMPETMEIALRECGTPRILLAAAASAAGKLLRQRGWFYLVAGSGASAIDGPCPNTIPPYNHCVVPAPLLPDLECRRLSQILGCPVVIVDINDLGGKVLGASSMDLDRRLISDALRDNPLGQGDEHTPAGILRPEGTPGPVVSPPPENLAVQAQQFSDLSELLRADSLCGLPQFRAKVSLREQ